MQLESESERGTKTHQAYFGVYTQTAGESPSVSSIQQGENTVLPSELSHVHFSTTCLFTFNFNLIYPPFSITSKKYIHYKTFRSKKCLQSRWLHSCLYNSLPTIPVQAHSWAQTYMFRWCLESGQCSLPVYWNFILDNCFVELFVTVVGSMQTSSFLLYGNRPRCRAQHCWCVLLVMVPKTLT